MIDKLIWIHYVPFNEPPSFDTMTSFPLMDSTEETLKERAGWRGIDSEIKSGWAPSPGRDELLKRIEILEARLLALGGSIE